MVIWSILIKLIKACGQVPLRLERGFVNINFNEMQCYQILLYFFLFLVFLLNF